MSAWIYRVSWIDDIEGDGGEEPKSLHAASGILAGLAISIVFWAVLLAAVLVGG